MIDTHCHLTFPDYHTDKLPGGVQGVLERARAAGVAGAITVSTTTAAAVQNLEIAKKFDNVWCTSGVHPLYSDERPHDWEQLRQVARHERCVAWGELGLDNHYDRPPRSVQDRVLEEQLAVIENARPEIDKPIVLHCREAFDDLLAVLKQSKLPPQRMVFHCFTGAAAEAQRCLDFGAWISFTGVVTYHNAAAVQEAAKIVPADRIMVETDAPFLTPAPHRGKRPNEPQYARVTAEFLAALRGRPWQDFERQLDENTRRFFGIEWSERQ